jgi:hypothetical protein
MQGELEAYKKHRCHLNDSKRVVEAGEFEVQHSWIEYSDQAF